MTTNPRTPGDTLQLEAVRDGNPARDALEAFVREAFETKHGACIRSFMPTLLSFRDRAGTLRGVAGLRGAHEGRLYLEQYLDRPIEQALAESLAQRPELSGMPARRDVVEVGNLAGGTCRAAVRMVAQLPAYLRAERYSWIVFTATGTLRAILAGFGAPLVELARAEPARVRAAGDEWGRYYRTDPRVYAGYLPDADRLIGFAREDRSH